jgi:hypothetical protein
MNKLRRRRRSCDEPPRVPAHRGVGVRGRRFRRLLAEDFDS